MFSYILKKIRIISHTCFLEIKSLFLWKKVFKRKKNVPNVLDLQFCLFFFLFFFLCILYYNTNKDTKRHLEIFVAHACTQAHVSGSNANRILPVTGTIWNHSCDLFPIFLRAVQLYFDKYKCKWNHDNTSTKKTNRGKLDLRNMGLSSVYSHSKGRNKECILKLKKEGQRRKKI